MRPVRRWRIEAALALFFCVAVAGTSSVDAAPTHESLLPDSTVLYLHASQLEELQNKWHTIQFGKILADESMEVFAAKWRTFVNSKLHSYVQTTGLTAEEILQFAREGISVAIVPDERGNAAYVVLADIGGRHEEAQQLMLAAGQRLQAAGAARSDHTAHSVEFIVFRSSFDRQPTRESAFAIHNDLLCISTSVSTMEGILEHWADGGSHSLEVHEAFQQIMNQCDRAPGDGHPDACAFVDPVGYLRVLYSQGHKRLDKHDPVEFLVHHGFDAIRGLGGVVNLATDSTEVTMRLAVFAPPPYGGAMGMFQMPSSDSFSPPDWLTNDVSMFGVVNLDLMAVLDHVGPLFDDIIADGVEGTFDDILSDLEAADGPQVNMRNDLMVNLGARIVLLNDQGSLADSPKDRSLVAIEANDDSAVAMAIKKLLRDDPGVRRLRLAAMDNDLWQIGEDSGVFSGDGQPRKISSSAVIVANGSLLLATDVNFVRKVIVAGRTDDPRLSVATDLAQLESCLQKYVPGVGVGRIYSRTARDLHATYEFLRSGSTTPSESILGLLASKLVAALRDRDTGELSLDFSCLPPYQRISDQLGGIGIAGKNTENGWYVVAVAVAPTEP